MVVNRAMQVKNMLDTIYLKSRFLYGKDFEFKKGILVIEDNIVKEITFENISENTSGYVKYSGIVIPPLINAHTHIGDNVIKDIGINKSLDELVKPPDGLKHKFLNTCDDKKLMYGMLDGLHELYRSGTRYFCDFRENGLNGVLLLKKALMHFNEFLSDKIHSIDSTKNFGEFNPQFIIDNNSDSNTHSVNGYANHNINKFINSSILGRPKNADEAVLKKEIKEILNQADGLGLSGCNEYSDETLKFIRNQDYKIFSIHANEHEGSVNYSKNTYGKTEIERIVDLKLNPTFIIHATHTSSHDIDLLKENDIPVVVCPRANASFNVGLPNITKLLKNNIRIGLGTDNFMANSPSIFKEMDFIYKLYHIDPKEILRFATINNAKILGIENVGLVDEGYKPVFTYIKPNSINYSKNIVASIVTRCEKGDIDKSPLEHA